MNRWDPVRRVWVDLNTGNYMRPADAGGDDIWYSPHGTAYINGQWVQTALPAWASEGAAAYAAMSSTAVAGGALAPVLEADFISQQREHALQKYITDVTNQAAMERTQINIASAERVAAAERALRQQLQEGSISAQKYMQERELAQKESEFVRDLALRSLEQRQNHEIKTAQLELARLSELRQERQLQAQLAANPQDFVAYEFYKRMLGRPQAWDVAQQFAAGSPQVGQATQQPENLLGQPYEAAPPAYSDETLATLASSLYGDTPTRQALYNPQLSGRGVFGAQIRSPGEISRGEAFNLSENEIGILSSFLRAGVERDGRRIALDPREYFTQVSRSWVPTLAEAGGQTAYRF